MQLDFGQFRGRGGLKIFIFAAVLSASRYKYVTFQDHPFKTKEVIFHLLSCFDYYGGMPKELVIDQDSLMVVSENAGDIIYTDDFKFFSEEQDIRMYVCRKADPESKGKIENVIKYVKYNFFNTRDFLNIEEANKSVFKWLKRRTNGKISQATKQIPALLIENETPSFANLNDTYVFFKREANLFFSLISETYEKTSIIVTSNKSFESWAEMMGDTVMTYAMLDRLLHHARVFTLDGESYRIKNKNKEVKSFPAH